MFVDYPGKKESILQGKGSLLPYSLARKFGVIPIEPVPQGPVYLLTSRNQGGLEQNQLRFILKREVLFVKITDDEFSGSLDSTWTAEEKRQGDSTIGGDGQFNAQLASSGPSQSGSQGRLRLDDIQDGGNVVQQVDHILSRAVNLGASDIHFEPQETELNVRFRLDGVLQPVLAIPKARQNEILSRLKILSHMDIAEKRRPQDGRFAIGGQEKTIDVRVSSMPTQHGEKLVLRLLDKARQPLDLQAIGMEGGNLELFSAAIKKSFGMILVTGPTGSGKTTTLYSALKTIQTPEINISTVEDPIEFQLAGINQTQMKEEIDYTFAAAVRTFLRQDPDVIMVGEIRDAETAKYAIQAAQTGHLVFSTLHTNDAPGAMIRLFEMGVEPFLVASTIHLVIAQRLVRKICMTCKTDRPLTDSEKAYAKKSSFELARVSFGKGCTACGSTGFRGRTAVFEMMPVSPEIQDVVTTKGSTQKVRDLALSQGMRDLLHEGFRLVSEGITTLDEVRSAAG
jgi:type II secretory ATPase GspE/PulE/Tfp pilus assembly ATPase PilB-like protein